jgi:hypothetical protein
LERRGAEDRRRGGGSDYRVWGGGGLVRVYGKEEEGEGGEGGVPPCCIYETIHFFGGRVWGTARGRGAVDSGGGRGGDPDDAVEALRRLIAAELQRPQRSRVRRDAAEQHGAHPGVAAAGLHDEVRHSREEDSVGEGGGGA